MNANDLEFMTMEVYVSGMVAQQYLLSLEGQVHPSTKRTPVIVGELQEALRKGAVTTADRMAHNYAIHGRVDAVERCSAQCFDRGVTVEIYSSTN